MYHIEADPVLNLLVLRLEGFMTDEQLRRAADQCIAESKKLNQGYSVINDISKMKPASQKGAEEIRRAQTYVASHGVGKVVRVVDNPVAKMQFDRTSGEVGYKALEAHSVEEAYALI